ncbi:MAG: hypothetical protein V4517_00165 [Pseudomonadota bacterium]
MRGDFHAARFRSTRLRSDLHEYRVRKYLGAFSSASFLIFSWGLDHDQSLINRIGMWRHGCSPCSVAACRTFDRLRAGGKPDERTFGIRRLRLR